MANPHSQNDDALPTKVDELICFALYSANNAMNRTYQPLLAPLGLTYPQYITLTALWEKDAITVGQLCKKLMTETSTLTPVLKRLESQGYLERRRGTEDERQVFLFLTKNGRELQLKAPEITRCVIKNTNVSPELLDILNLQLQDLRNNLREV